MKKFLFSLFLIFFSTLSATAHAAEYASEELITKFSKYIHSIDPDVECKLLRKVTPQELCQGLRPIALVESQMPWTHTLKKMLSGKKKWKKGVIERASISLTYVDCEFAREAIPLILALGNTYTNENWNFTTPITLYLFEERSEYQETLQFLADIVNAAYPKYFNVTPCVEVPSNSTIVMACNQCSSRAIIEFQDMLKDNGLLFLLKASSVNFKESSIMKSIELEWQRQCPLGTQGFTFVKQKSLTF